jgi:hypothetical protein
MMSNIRQAMHVVLAIFVAAILVVGVANTVQGQIVQPGDIDNPGVTVVQRITPNTHAGPWSIISHEVEIQTSRSNGISDAWVHMRYDPAVVQVVSAEFIQREHSNQKETVASDAWVTARNDAEGTLSFETGRINNDKAIFGRFTFVVLGSAPEGSHLMDRLTFEWVNEHGERKLGVGNKPIVTVGGGDYHREHYTISVSPQVAPTGTKRVFESEPIYAPGEHVAVWYNTPSGESVDVGSAAADYNGKIRFEMETWGMGDGTYTVVAQGQWSHFTSVGLFDVGTPQPQPPQPQPGASAGQTQGAGCIDCHTKHNVVAPHPPQPNCTNCHGDSKPPIEKGCIDCHSSPKHQGVVQMPHPPKPTQADQPCATCHGR